MNPAMLGLRTHKGEVTGPATWPAIIDPETYYRLYDMLSQPDRRTTDSREPTTLLSGILKCGTCGKGMHRRRRRNGISHYKCPDEHAVRTREWLDGLVSDLAVCILAAQLRYALHGSLSGGDDHSRTQRDVEDAEKELERARAQLNELIGNLPTMGLAPADAAGMVRSYRSVVDDAEDKLKKLVATRGRATDETTQRIRQTITLMSSAMPSDDVSSDAARRFIDLAMSGDLEERAESLWLGADLSAQREFIRSHVHLQTVYAPRKRKSLEGIDIAPVAGWESLGEFLPWWKQPDWNRPNM